MIVKIKYWSWENKKNQGLCDLKGIGEVGKTELSISSTGIIYRKQQTYQLMFLSIVKAPKNGVLPEYEPLLFIKEVEGQYKITDLKKGQESDEPLTLVAPVMTNYLKNTDEYLSVGEGQILKIGKIRIKILKVKILDKKEQSIYSKKVQKPSIEKINKITLSDYQKIKSIEPQKKEFSESDQKQMSSRSSLCFSQISENPTCKICYSKTIQQDNPLVCFCKCSGTTKFLHQKCLKTWIWQRAQISYIKKGKDNKLVYFANMCGFECQICKQFYEADSLFESIFENSEVLSDQYVIFVVEELQRKTLYLVNLKDFPEITIGRDQERHIEINDLTVSRNHCKILFNQKRKQLELIDSGSKFGTSVKKTSVMIQKLKNPYRFQKGRTYMEISKSNNEEKGFLNKFLMCYHH